MVKLSFMNILPLPAFTDNYIWLIEENGKATVVDPGDAEVVNNCLKEKNLELENILITHHHFCLLYTSPSPRDVEESRMPSSA